ncbi:MAG TPA: protein-disulfide reductase DsbD N-terminal domain-containing protein [Gemmatimonadaceae bacterium]|nr:protein-disulfide reductase DsbD N-terminal domain-containing protein [Gemmatimonadaceae bacterium]
MNRIGYLILVPLVATSSGPPRAPNAEAGNDITNESFVAGERLSIRPVKWTVIGGSEARDVVSGRTVPIILQAEIAKGWHIYSLTQKAGGPIPLRLELVGPPDVVVRGVIKAPKPDRFFDKNFGIETELYSGSPRFTIPVGVPGRALSGIRKFQIGARYQVCSDKMCLPPRTDRLDVAIRIAGAT